MADWTFIQMFLVQFMYGNLFMFHPNRRRITMLKKGSLSMELSSPWGIQMFPNDTSWLFTHPWHLSGYKRWTGISLCMTLLTVLLCDVTADSSGLKNRSKLFGLNDWKLLTRNTCKKNPLTVMVILYELRGVCLGSPCGELKFQDGVQFFKLGVRWHFRGINSVV